MCRRLEKNVLDTIFYFIIFSMFSIFKNLVEPGSVNDVYMVSDPSKLHRFNRIWIRPTLNPSITNPPSLHISIQHSPQYCIKIYIRIKFSPSSCPPYTLHISVGPPSSLTSCAGFFLSLNVHSAIHLFSSHSCPMGGVILFEF